MKQKSFALESDACADSKQQSAQIVKSNICKDGGEFLPQGITAYLRGGSCVLFAAADVLPMLVQAPGPTKIAHSQCGSAVHVISGIVVRTAVDDAIHIQV